MFLVIKKTNLQKERRKDNGLWYYTVNYYRDNFSISNWNIINDWINESIILVRDHTYNSSWNNFYKPYEKMIYKLLKKFSSWLNYRLWKHEVKLKTKRFKKEGKLWNIYLLY